MKSTRIVPVLLSFFIASLISVQAQTPDLLPGELYRQDGIFYEGPQEISRSDFWQKLDDHPQARVLYRRGDRQDFWGTVAVSAGGIVTLGGGLVLLTGSLVDSDYNTEGTLVTLAGFGTLLSGIAMIRSGKKNLERAIDTYNHFEVDQKRIGFGIGPNGVGLRINLSR